MHKDNSHNLSDNGQPTQLDQQQEIASVRGICKMAPAHVLSCPDDLQSVHYPG
ncbi:hypothetical protein GbCGDNIH7_8326 [Granulibacter bethesdensis]|nr:hypothetical protein GbCGDNIH7_8326 [Granulibacter bethesdensis]